jgi:thymidylate synthase
MEQNSEEEQLEWGDPYPFQSLEIGNKRENFNEYDDDFQIIGYKRHEAITMKMVA